MTQFSPADLVMLLATLRDEKGEIVVQMPQARRIVLEPFCLEDALLACVISGKSHLQSTRQLVDIY